MNVGDGNSRYIIAEERNRRRYFWKIDLMFAKWWRSLLDVLVFGASQLISVWLWQGLIEVTIFVCVGCSWTWRDTLKLTIENLSNLPLKKVFLCALALFLGFKVLGLAYGSPLSLGGVERLSCWSIWARVQVEVTQIAEPHDRKKVVITSNREFCLAFWRN